MSSNKYVKQLIKVVAAGALAGASSLALAYDFVPNEAEFESWSTKCKGLYLSTVIGRRSEFANRMPTEQVQAFRNETKITKGGPWHYCAGLIWHQRGKREFNPQQKSRFLEKAVTEYSFTVRTIKKDIGWYGEMLVNLGMAHRDLKNYPKAMEFIDEAIQRFPDYQAAYLAKALVYRDAKEINNAIRSLENAPEKFLTHSAELNYYLGLMHFEAEDIAQATHYADIAYKLGYPLPGLKNKLAKYNKNNEK